MRASLNDMLGCVKWGEYKMGDLFCRVKTRKLPYKADELPDRASGEYDLPCLTSSFNNQGLNYYAPSAGATILKNVISIPSNSDVYRAYYQSRDFTVLSDAYAIKWKYDDRFISANQYIFMVMCINKVTDLPIYSYKNKLGGWNVVKNKCIKLPIKEGTIDFDFMEHFIATLEEARITRLSMYLQASGLDDCLLTTEEEKAILDYGTYDWGSFNLKDLYGKSTRGKRLKSEDRIPGTLPFVTAGESEEGVSAFIGNSVQIFDKNTITIDMFGSAKYRNYRYGGDDHVAIVHTENIPMNAAAFVTSAIHKAAHTGEYDYGHNFYAKDADSLNIMLPKKEGQPDYQAMEILISAIKKKVIKELVVFTKHKMASI